MNRAKRILTRGWFGKALRILTFGYYPAQDVATGTPIVKITYSFARRHDSFGWSSRMISFSFAERIISFVFAARRQTFAGWRKRTQTCTFAHRSMTFSFIGNELG